MDAPTATPDVEPEAITAEMPTVASEEPDGTEGSVTNLLMFSWIDLVVGLRTRNSKQINTFIAGIDALMVENQTSSTPLPVEAEIPINVVHRTSRWPRRRTVARFTIVLTDEVTDEQLSTFRESLQGLMESTTSAVWSELGTGAFGISRIVLPLDEEPPTS